MFDVKNEKPIKLMDASGLGLWPRPPAFTTLLRWSRHGYKDTRIILETARIGNALCTSEAAIIRFIERLSGTPSGTRTASEQSVAHAAAERALDAAGIK